MSYFATGAALTAALNALPASLTGTYKAFDAFYYAAQYMGNYTGTLTPIEHFVQVGAARGYQPNADFNPAFYQSKYSDLAGLDAADLLFHYVKFGLNEGRAGNATLAAYNWADYLAAYPAVAAYVNANLSSFAGSVTNGAIAHYVKFGAQQGFTLPNTVGQTFTLTTSVDNVVGTAGGDTINASNTTLSSLDVVDGGAGNDTLNLIDSTGQGTTSLAINAGVTVKNVETLNVVSNQNIGKVTSTAAVFDVSGFTGLTKATFTSTGTTNGSNIKVGAGVTTTVTTAADATTVSGGVNTTVVGQAAVIVSGADLTAANVTTATSSAQVDIGSTSNSATTAAPKLVSATVKGGSAINIADYDGATSAASTGTLTTATISETGATAVSISGKAFTNLNVGKQTTATAVTVTNATVDHTLNVSLADSGKTGQVVSVIDAAAKSFALTAGGTANFARIGDGSTTNTTAKAVTISGAGALTLDVDATHLTAVTSVDGSAATGDLTLSNVAAATTTVKTGAGKDAFTLTATTKVTVDAGAGNDVVTLGSTVAAGSTVNLGTGDDKLLSNSGAVAASTAASGATPAAITTIDGGAGTDLLAASLINSGNGAQFINFETLGLTNSSVDASLLTGSTITGLELLAGGGTYTNVTAAQSLAANTTTTGTTTLTLSGVSGTADSYTVTFGSVNTTTPTSANMA
ncbi:MAG: beta strand repeat-containing protein, partial [Rhodoluna sp.]